MKSYMLRRVRFSVPSHGVNKNCKANGGILVYLLRLESPNPKNGKENNHIMMMLILYIH